MNSVDTRVVEMKFDNDQFEDGVKTSMSTLEKLKNSLKFSADKTGLEEIGRAAGNISFDGLQNAIGLVNSKFSVMGTVADQVIRNITTSVMTSVSSITRSVFGLVKTGGLNRALNIEQAKFQLKGLGIAWDDIKDDIDYAVKGTAYGLDAAAKAASQLSASGIKLGKDMKSSLRGISGVAAMTNSSYEEISHVFTAVAGQGRVMAVNLNSLAARGMNAAAELAKYLGKTEAEVRDMVSKGQIDFQTFADAMDKAFGEHAKDANATFTGSLANVKAALSRIGAKVATDALEDLRVVFNSLIPVIDNVSAALDPLIGLLNNALKGISEFASETISGLNVDGFAKRVKGAVSTLESSLRNPYKSKVVSLEAWKELTDTGLFGPATVAAIYRVAKTHNKSIADMEKKFGGFSEAVKNGAVRVDYIDELVQSIGKNFSEIDVDKMTKKEIKATGYTRAQLKAIIKLRDAYGDQFSEFRNIMDLLESPKAFDLFVDALRNISSQLNIVKTSVSDAFSSVFGSFGDIDLYSIIKQFYEFSKSIRLSDDSALGIQGIFTGIFKVVNGVIRGISTAINVLSPLKKLFDTIAGTSFHVLEDVGYLIGKVVDDAQSSTELAAVLDTIKSAIQDFTNTAINSTIFKSIIDFFDSLVDSAKDVNIIDELIRYLRDVRDSFEKFTGIDLGKVTSGIGDFFNTLLTADYSFLGTIIEAIGGFFVSLRDIDFSPFEFVTERFTVFTDNMSRLWGVLQSLFTPIRQFFESFIESISIAVGGLTPNDIIDLVSTGLIGSILLILKNDIPGILDSLRQSLQNLQESLKAEVLLRIAKAVGIMATSLIGLSFIEPERLRSALGILGALAAMVTAIYKVITMKKPGGSTGIQGLFDAFSSFIASYNRSAIWVIAKSVAVFAASLVVLTFAVSKLASLSWGELARGLVALAGMSIILVGLATSMYAVSNAFNGGKVGFEIVFMAVAIKILSTAVATLGAIPFNQLLTGLGATLLLLVGLAASMALIESSNPKKMLSVGAALMGMALAVLTLSGAIKIIASIKDTDGLLNGVATIGGLILLLTVSTMALSGSKVLGAALALITMANSVLILTGAIAILGHMEFDTLKQGLVAVMALIAGLTIAIRILSGANVLKSTVAILALTASLLLLAPVIKLLSTIPFDGVVTALVALAGVLTILGFAAMTLDRYMGSMLKLAGIMVIFSAALAVLAPTLAIFNTLKLSGILKTFLVIGGLIAILGAASAFLTGSGLIAGMYALVGVLAVFSVGALALAAALAILGPALDVAGASIVIFAGSLIGAIGVIISGLGELASRLGGALIAIGKAILDIIIELAPKIAEAIAVVITGVIQAIAGHLPEILAAILQFVVDILNGLSAYMGPVAQALVTLVISLINTVADAIRDNVDPLLDAVESIIEAVLEAIITGLQHIVEKIPGIGQVASAGLDLMKGGLQDFFGVGETSGADLASGINASTESISEATANVAATAGENLSGIPDVFSTYGSQAITGLQESLLGGVGDVDSATTEISNLMGTNLNTDMTSIGDESLGSFMTAFNDPSNFEGSFAAISENMSTELGSTDLSSTAGVLFENFTGELETQAPSAKSAGKSIGTFTVDGLNSANAQFKTAGSKDGKMFAAGVRDKKPEAKVAGSSLSLAAVDGANSQKHGMVRVGEDIAAGARIGIHNKASEVSSEAATMVSNAIAAAKRAAASKSPSKKTIRLGEDMDRGMIIGFRNLSGAVSNAASEMTKGSLNVMRNTIAGIGASLANGLDMTPTIRPVMDMSEIQNGSDYINSLFANMDVPVGTTASLMGRFAAIDDMSTKGTTAPPATAYTYGDMSVVVNAAPGQDANEIADVVIERITDELYKEAEAFA